MDQRASGPGCIGTAQAACYKSGQSLRRLALRVVEVGRDGHHGIANLGAKVSLGGLLAAGNTFSHSHHRQEQSPTELNTSVLILNPHLQGGPSS